MDELEKGYFQNNDTNPYQQGGGSQNPNGQPPQPPTLNDPPYFWQSIRHDNMAIACILIAFYFLNTTLQTIIMVLQMFIGGSFDSIVQSLSSGELAFNDYYDSVMSQVMDLLANIPGGIAISVIIAEALALLLFLILRGKRLFTTDITTTAGKMNFTDFTSLFLIAFSAQFVFSIVSFVVNSILSLFGMSATSLMEESIRALYNPSGFLYIVVFGPIMEEIIFRGAIMRTLEKHGKNYAIVMSSLFFGLFHVFLLQGAFAFCVGMILGYTAINYSMKWAILLHILVNGLATLMDVTLSVWVQMAIFFAVFVFAIVLLLKNKPRIKESLAKGKPRIKEAYRIAFSGGFLIVTICIVIFFGILLF